MAVKKKRRYSWFEYDVEMEDGTKVVLLGSENAPKQPQQLAAIEAIIPLINKSAFEKTIVRSAPVLSLAPSLENCAILTKIQGRQKRLRGYRRYLTFLEPNVLCGWLPLCKV